MQVIEKGSLDEYKTCTQAVTEVLNSVAGPKRWTTDDIARAHRVGQSRDGQPKPMIVKFNRWKDKMTVLSNADRPETSSSEARRLQTARSQKPSGNRRGSQEGRESGRLKERQTYCGTTTARLQDLRPSHNSRRHRGHNQPSKEQPVDRVNNGGHMPRDDNRDGDSPPVQNSGGERAISARANRTGAHSEAWTQALRADRLLGQQTVTATKCW